MIVETLIVMPPYEEHEIRSLTALETELLLIYLQELRSSQKNRDKEGLESDFSTQEDIAFTDAHDSVIATLKTRLNDPVRRRVRYSLASSQTPFLHSHSCSDEDDGTLGRFHIHLAGTLDLDPASNLRNVAAASRAIGSDKRGQTKICTNISPFFSIPL